MVGRARSSETDALLGKESLAVLSNMGFVDSMPRLRPHKYHGVAARMRKRLATFGKKEIITTAQQRQQHHKERITIQQVPQSESVRSELICVFDDGAMNVVNDLADITRDIDSFAKDGRRVPIAVWEKYDRINKRHKKHDHMIAIAAKMRHVERKRSSRLAATRSGADAFVDDVPLSIGTNLCGNICPHSSHQQLVKPKCPREGCRGMTESKTTFGRGRETNEKNKEALRFGGISHLSRSRSCPLSSWGRHEREKLNELYWELGRPPRRGVGAAREHFSRYTQRHCMLFPHRLPKEVVERLKVVLRYNALKEPNEREHWLKLGVSKRHFPKPDTKNAYEIDRAVNEKHCDPVREKSKGTFTPETVRLGRNLLDPSRFTDLSASTPKAYQTPLQPINGGRLKASEPLFRQSGGSSAPEERASMANASMRGRGVGNAAWGFGETSDRRPVSKEADTCYSSSSNNRRRSRGRVSRNGSFVADRPEEDESALGLRRKAGK